MKKIIPTTCTSFTSVLLLFMLLHQFDKTNITARLEHSTILQLFIMSVFISVLMYFSDRLQKKFDISLLWLDLIIRIAICYITVFTVGCIGGMFTFGWKAILEMTPILMLTFIITYTIFYLIRINYANQINEEIKSKR